LCGAESAFDKDESLAFTFAEKAARKGLPSAMFAMGYYAEVGVGGPKDINAAIKWYTKASEQGNEDAKERLSALSQPTAQPLSRQEHAAITENTLVRKRTQAKQRSELQLQPMPSGSAFGSLGGTRPDGQQVIENIRKNSVTAPLAQTLPPQQQQGRLPPMTEETGYPPPGLPSATAYHNQPEHSRPPNTSGPARPGAGANPRPHPNAHRYTLTDSGSAPLNASSPPHQQSLPPYAGGRPGQSPKPGPHRHGRVSSATNGDAIGITGGPSQTQQPAAYKVPGKGPTTFADMGFQGVKAEDKECVIM